MIMYDYVSVTLLAQLGRYLRVYFIPIVVATK